MEHKWKGIGYTHPHNEIDLQQAIVGPALQQ